MAFLQDFKTLHFMAPQKRGGRAVFPHRFPFPRIAHKPVCAIFFLGILTCGQFSSALAGKIRQSVLNINAVEFWAKNDGRLAEGPAWSYDWGLIFPKNTAGLVFTDGLVWGGFVKDGRTPELRVDGQYYRAGTVPGRILPSGIPADTTDPSARIWRIRRDWETADLTEDAASYFGVPAGQVTAGMTDSLRQLYRYDWEHWPAAMGAPFYDRNGNGRFDGGDEPGLGEADQVIWFAYNDAGSFELYRSPPISLEVQVTLWAYSPQTADENFNFALKHVLFKRYRIIYKGTAQTPPDARIDSMFVGQFVDTDIGYFGDDFLGCDTLLQLGYGYNSSTLDKAYRPFGLAPPCVGYSLLQGPFVPSEEPGAEGIRDFRRIRGFKNLPLTFFWAKRTGSTISDPSLGVYEGTIEMYRLLNGKTPQNGRPFLDPQGRPIRFMVPGDPVSRSGWIDGILLPAGARRFLMSTGPFSMALGDTQEVVFAVAVGKGADNLACIPVMKLSIKYARMLFQWGLVTDVATPAGREPNTPPAMIRLYAPRPNPFVSRTRLTYSLARPGYVRLTVFNLLGQPVAEPVNGFRSAGTYSAVWNGRDFSEQPLPGGVYLVRLQVEGRTLTQKVLLIR